MYGPVSCAGSPLAPPMRATPADGGFMVGGAEAAVRRTFDVLLTGRCVDEFSGDAESADPAGTGRRGLDAAVRAVAVGNVQMLCAFAV